MMDRIWERVWLGCYTFKNDILLFIRITSNQGKIEKTIGGLHERLPSS